MLMWMANLDATSQHLDESLALDCDKALTLLARAAVEVAAAQHDAAKWERALPLVMHALAWANRVRAHQRSMPLSVAQCLAHFERPLSEIFEGEGRGSLLEGGEPTELCSELVCGDAGSMPLSDVEQGVVVEVMKNLQGEPDSQSRYVAFRRALIEAPTQERPAAAQLASSVNVPLAKLFSAFASDVKVHVDGHESFLPCPRCRWPMRISESIVSCRSSTCVALGARFHREGSSLMALGALLPPSRVTCGESVVLRHGLWRFTTLPGLEELTLEKRLLALSGIDVELWPNLDEYDLSIRKGGRELFRVDVKDRVSVHRLARELCERAATELTIIVVPDARAHQVDVLAQRVPSTQGYRFLKSSDLIDLVREGK